MLRRLLRSPRADIEVGIAVPIGCLVPLAVAVAVGVGAGVVVGTRLGQSSTPDRVTVRVIDEGAKGGPTILATQVVPLR